jgi:hypothetical protein
VSVCKLRALVIRFLLPMPMLGRAIGDSTAGRILSNLQFTATRFKLIPGVADPYTFGVGGLGGLNTRVDRVVLAGCITEG